MRTCAAGEVFDERRDQPMNRLWRGLDVTVTSAIANVIAAATPGSFTEVDIPLD